MLTHAEFRSKRGQENAECIRAITIPHQDRLKDDLMIHLDNRFADWVVLVAGYSLLHISQLNVIHYCWGKKNLKMLFTAPPWVFHYPLFIGWSQSNSDKEPKGPQNIAFGLSYCNEWHSGAVRLQMEYSAFRMLNQTSKNDQTCVYVLTLKFGGQTLKLVWNMMCSINVVTRALWHAFRASFFVGVEISCQCHVYF